MTRPASNQFKGSPNPRGVFEKHRQNLSVAKMEESVEVHEQLDKCQELSRDLDLYTS
jgi:hypothetical protein